MLIDENPRQTQTELAAALNVTQQCILQHLRSIGMIRKLGNWFLNELTKGDIQRRKLICKFLFQRQKRKGFLHQIVTGDKNWIHYDNPKCKAALVKPCEPGT